MDQFPAAVFFSVSALFATLSVLEVCPSSGEGLFSYSYLCTGAV